MAILSFLFPIVGFILWAIKKNTEPEEAETCLKWAFIGVAVWVILYLLTYLI